ncbi:MAG TPA: hypothetical protein VKS79_05180 [Gemmataceae bacterium]|nr:hypothetical protein [Gemmataceae bacterium]
MRRAFILTLTVTMAIARIACGDDPKPELADRIKAVRQMFEKVPPLVLGLAEPVEIMMGAAYEDGGTTILKFKDANAQTILFHLDKKIGSSTRGTMFVQMGQRPEKPVVLRGAEEAALYGLLLRWNAPAQVDARISFGVEVMRSNLDERFAAEVKQSPEGGNAIGQKARGMAGYLTSEGKLKERLVVRDTGGFAGVGTGRKYVVEPSGEWTCINLVNGKKVETKGQLTATELRDLANALSRYDLFNFPKEVNRMTVADGFNVMIEFGEHRSTFFGKTGFLDLPKSADDTTVGRFSGVTQAVQQMLLAPNKKD